MHYDDNFYKRVQSHFGEESQWGKVIEECSELIYVSVRCQREGVSKWYEELIGETADVLVMTEHLAVLSGNPEKFRRDVEARKLQKLARLETSLLGE